MMWKLVVSLSLIFSWAFISADQVVEVTHIRFTGLKAVSRYSIIKKSGIKSDNGKIVVNISRLKKTLREEELIENYKLIDKNGVLTIIVEEESPEYLVYILGEKRDLYFELDKRFTVVSSERVHKVVSPLIIINGSDLDGRTLNDILISRITEIYKDGETEEIWKQVKVLDLSESRYVTVKLFGRPTEFVFSEGRLSFKRLNAMVCYLDAVKRYPRSIDLTDRVVVVD